MRLASRTVTHALFALAVVLAACAKHHAPPPVANKLVRHAPDLSGNKVMLFPVQGSGMGGGGVGTKAAGPLQRVPAVLDSAIADALSAKAPDVRWVGRAQLERVLARSPMLSVDLHALAVASFRRAQVEMIGDPLYGDLRTLGGIVDARFALVPVTAAYVPQADGTGRIEIAVALIDTSLADVLWYGVAAGSNGAANDAAAATSAAEQPRTLDCNGAARK